MRAFLLFGLALLCARFCFAEPRFRIGVSTALTGEAAPYGLDTQDILRFAAEELYGGECELVVEDDRCSGRDAVNAAHKLIEVDKVQAVIGYSCSGAALAAAPLLERAQIPTMVTCASAPKISQAGDFLFRTTPSDKLAGEMLRNWAAAKHNRLGILAEETEYSQGLKNAFMQTGGDKSPVIVSEDFVSGTTDFRTLLTKLKAARIEGLFLDTQTEIGLAAVLRQMRALQWRVALYGAYWPASPAFLKIAGTDAEGIEFINTPSFSTLFNDDGRRVYARYKERCGPLRSVDSLFASNYEGFHALLAALRSGKDVRNFLYQTKFDGIFGPYHFDKNGDIVGLPFAMMRIEQGKPVVLPPR